MKQAFKESVEYCERSYEQVESVVYAYASKLECFLREAVRFFPDCYIQMWSNDV